MQWLQPVLEFAREQCGRARGGARHARTKLPDPNHNFSLPPSALWFGLLCSVLRTESLSGEGGNPGPISNRVFRAVAAGSPREQKTVAHLMLIHTFAL